MIFNHVLLDGKTCVGEVKIPEGVTYICPGAFEMNMQLTSVVFPESLNEIGKAAFMYCTELTDVKLPKNLEVLTTSVFSFCEKLAAIELPENLMRIDEYAFECCTALSEVTFPENDMTISAEAFNDTPWLEIKRAENPLVIVNRTLIDGKTCTGDVVIPKNVAYISAEAFDGNENITSVVVPARVDNIWKNTFRGCSNLKSVELLGTGYIASDAFCDCATLKTLRLSRRLSIIDDWAFNGCKTRGMIYYSGTEEQWAEVEKGSNNLFLRISEYTYGTAGDANNDGQLTVADVVALQRWLHVDSEVKINCDLTDLNDDDTVNIVDLALLKRELLKK